MGPIATLWAEAMRDRGHDVSVVAAHSHYPGPLWGQRLLPYREVRNGIRVLKLPLWIGRGRAGARLREEATYAASAAVAATVLPTPDVYVVVSPAFAALLPIGLSARLRRRPWVLWLQDILPDAAIATGLLREGAALRAARLLERRAYRSAARIVVISETFHQNLLAKGVPGAKIVRIYNPAVRGFADAPRQPHVPLRILYAGNIGLSQGLEDVLPALVHGDPGVELTVVGTGERLDAVRAVAAPLLDRVRVLGLVDDETIGVELNRADVAVLTQRPDVAEFNVPSRLMTFLARGLPVLAVVRRDSEVRRIVDQAGAGLVVLAEDLSELPGVIAASAADPARLMEWSRSALDYARATFAPSTFVDTFEDVLESVASDRLTA